jgi:hypothetical protein
MRILKTILVTISVSCLSSITTGCFYTTRYVSRIGKTHERYNRPVEAYVFPDKSIIAGTSARYYREAGRAIWIPDERNMEIKPRWVLVRSETVELLARSQGSDQTVLPEGVRITLEYPSRWAQVIPSDFRASPQDPPLDISQAIAHHSEFRNGRFLIPIFMNGETFLFELRPDIDSERKKRSLYAYPVIAVLIPPALTFDLITLPIQAVIALYEFASLF